MRLNRSRQEQLLKSASGDKQEDSAVQSHGLFLATKSSYVMSRDKNIHLKQVVLERSTLKVSTSE